ncbi:LysR family transcriptional regulator [Guggenheimella bovis]
MQNLERYRTFLVAAKHENFSKAALELYVSQSSVSQTIGALEDSLGLKLFHRQGKKISLTPEGTLLYNELLPAFERIEHGENILREMTSLESGSIRVGASDTLCRHYLIEHFKRFREQFPKLKLTIQNTRSPRVFDLLKEGLIDVGFINGTKEDCAGFDAEPIADVTEVFFTSNAYPELLGRKLSKEELKKCPFVTLGPRTSTRLVLDKLLHSPKHFAPSVEVISIDLLVDMIEAGFGVGFTHRNIVEKKNLPIIETDFPIPKRKLFMVTNLNQFLSPSTQAFMDIVRKNLA